MLYKVKYYTLSRGADGSIGNIKQYSDVWYTEVCIANILQVLEAIVKSKKNDKYVPVVTNIEMIDGHL